MSRFILNEKNSFSLPQNLNNTNKMELRSSLTEMCFFFRLSHRSERSVDISRVSLSRKFPVEAHCAILRWKRNDISIV